MDTRRYIFKDPHRGFGRIEVEPDGTMTYFRIVGAPLLGASESAIISGGVPNARWHASQITRAQLKRSWQDDLVLTLQFSEPEAIVGQQSLQIESCGAELPFHGFLARLRGLIGERGVFDDTVFGDGSAAGTERRFALGSGDKEGVTTRGVIVVRWIFLGVVSLVVPPLAVVFIPYVIWLVTRRFRVIASARDLLVRRRHRSQRLAWQEITAAEVTPVAVLGNRYLLLELQTSKGRVPLPTSGIEGMKLMRELEQHDIPVSVAA